MFLTSLSETLITIKMDGDEEQYVLLYAHNSLLIPSSPNIIFESRICSNNDKRETFLHFNIATILGPGYRS